MAGGLAAPVPLAPGAQPIVTIEHSVAILATFLGGSFMLHHAPGGRGNSASASAWNGGHLGVRHSRPQLPEHA